MTENITASYYCGSQCHQAGTAGLLNKLGDKTGTQDAHSTDSRTFPSRGQLLLHLKTLGSGATSTGGLSAVPDKAWDESGPGSIRGAQAGDEDRGRTRGKDAVKTSHKTGQHNSGGSDCPGMSFNRAPAAFGLGGGVSR